MSLPIVILISGNGSNLQAIIDAIDQGLDVEIRAVISNRPNAFGLERAKRAHLHTHLINHRQFSNRADFETALQTQIDHYQPSLIVLAGFMRRLSAEFVQHYAGRMINIHPSLLPKYPGLNTHRRVLTNQELTHGVTIHYVTADIDAGPIICQSQLTIDPGETEQSLQTRIHQLEHRLYPQVLAWIAAGRLQLTDQGQVLLDHQPPTCHSCAGGNPSLHPPKCED